MYYSSGRWGARGLSFCRAGLQTCKHAQDTFLAKLQVDVAREKQRKVGLCTTIGVLPKYMCMCVSLLYIDTTTTDTYVTIWQHSTCSLVCLQSFLSLCAVEEIEKLHCTHS